MRSWHTPIEHLKGVGPQRTRALATAGVRTFRDLLWYLPRRYLDRSTIVPIRELQPQQGGVTVLGQVRAQALVEGLRGRSRFEVLLDDGTGQLVCVWFQGLSWISKQFQTGQWVAFHGVPQRYGARLQLVHPDYDKLEGDSDPPLRTGAIIPLYPGSQALERVNLNSVGIRRLLRRLLEEPLPPLPDPLPEWIRTRYGLMPLQEALITVHVPPSWALLEEAQRRLKFDELFTLQLLLAWSRYGGGAQPQRGPVFERAGPRFRAFYERLPFVLTEGQKQAIRDIYRDVRRGGLMNRLLQGDVGSGKTIVAIAAMLLALDSGYQAALMAPTEILAEQHYSVLQEHIGHIDVQIGLLTGSLGRAERARLLEAISTGAIQILVGTHALIQEDVRFHRLGLVVIDEQHRFGVLQRAALRRKGSCPHLLVMTATPIPRSLALTLYGDLDVSIIRELPRGRKPVSTHLVSETQREALYGFLEGELARGRQAYIVYPLVEESEALDLRNAQAGYAQIRARFPHRRVGLLHGRMPAGEKEAVMRAFKAGELDILVATTVIEVGIDAPNATVIVIEHAERFGLAQLHQLRGRVGRGSERAHCFLVASSPRSPEAEARLRVLLETTDGFRLAERDLELRGPGDFFGTRQTGLPELRMANLLTDQAILQQAREAALTLIERDPSLAEPAHRELAELLRTRYGLPLELARIG
ncbi:MAG: ATP-dependent DNA helicase RecG [Bacteroidetes bacterium]|nr:ATP-dependent DNA helicase RecG [Rhodothermia bacterium]MCX7907868.1 ATP-dependent DNA helicase RecG [Bacteroidota bacterium]MDW8284727.1 ATP-dependent DNA helicase RecG [Bacteroidota bacterium]